MCITSLPITTNNKKLTISSRYRCVFLRKIFNFAANFNRIVQTQIIDLTEACKYVDIVEKKHKKDKEFLRIVIDHLPTLTFRYYVTASRITNRQKGLTNNPPETAKVYNKINVYYQFLDNVLSKLSATFSNHHEKFWYLQIFLPKCMKN
jgi:hypothetical protein